MTRRQIQAGVGIGVGIVVVAVLVIAVVWRGSASDSDAAPEPSPVTCSDDGLTSVLADGADQPDLQSAPRGAGAAPRDVGRRDRPPRFDYSRADSYDLGYRVDPERGVLTYTAGGDDPDAAIWTSSISTEPLDDLFIDVSGLPHRRDLLAIGAQRQEDGVPLLVVVDTDGAVQLSCSVDESTGERMVGASSLAPDGSVLFLSDADDENAWISAHSTQDGDHLWSVPGVAWSADDDRAYVADGPGVTAYDLETGEESWATDVDWNFDDATTGLDAGEADPESWTLAAVGDEVYAYPDGARRLVALHVRDGRITWDLAPGDAETTGMDVTELDRDGRVMLRFGQAVAVRDPESRSWWWLYRATEHLRRPTVLTRSVEPTVVAFVSNNPNSDLPLTVVTDSGDRMATVPYRGRDHAYAVADTVVYVLSETDQTVTGYDLESSEQLWSVQLPAGADEPPNGIRAVDGGFDVFLDDGAYVRFRDDVS